MKANLFDVKYFV